MYNLKMMYAAFEFKKIGSMPLAVPNSRGESHAPLIFSLDADTLAVIFSGRVLLGMRVCWSWWKEFPVIMPMKIRLALVEGWPAHMKMISKCLTRFMDLSTELSIRNVKLS